MKILIADDKEETRKLLSGILRGLGQNVIESLNSDDAFKLLQDNGFDLVISGLFEPILDGLQFCHKAKSNDKTKTIPFLFSIFGSIDNIDVDYARKLGADGFINNAEEITVLNARLQKIVEEIQTKVFKINFVSSPEEKETLQEYTRHFLRRYVDVNAKYQTLFESAGDGIMVLKDYKFVECNKKALEIFGCQLTDIVGSYPYDFSPEKQPDNRSSKEKAIELMDEALTGKPMFFEWVHTRLDDSLFDAEVSLRRFELPDGIYLLALVRDITERKRIQERLRQNEELFRTVFESAQDCVFIKDKSSKYILVNKCTAKLFGTECDKITGKGDYDFFPAEIAEQIATEDKKVLQGEIVESFPIKKIGNKIIKFHTIKVPLHDEKGNIWGLCGIARDITEHEKLQEKLRKSEERLILITENVTDIIFLLDLELKFTFLSPSVQLMGYKIRELLGVSVEKILATEEYNEVLKIFKEEIEIEKHLNKDLNRIRTLITQLKRKDNSKIWMEVKLKFLRDKAKTPMGILGVARDITDSYVAHQELKKSYEQIDQVLHGTVAALASVVEKRDPYTAGHQRRVSELACAIAEEMNLSRDIIDYLRIAASLHDVGKIYVPAEILAKPTRLTPAEFEIIKTHPHVGFEILRPVDFPWPIPEIVLQHHEKMDGSGYPIGLTGDKIMLEAKILCVADIVEAMISHRPYREALGLDQALGDINKGRGIKFDERIVDICTNLFKEKGFKFSK